MKKIVLPALVLLVVSSLAALADDDEKKPVQVYELRTYFAHEGKLDDLHARFRDHTCALFEKHGMKNIGYWVPEDNKANKLVYLISHASRDAGQKSWQGFFKDPIWVAAYKASTREGKLVRKVERQFLTATDYSPALKIETQDPARLFELRIYSTNEGKRPDINKRFRDHTCALFTKHGITNVLYCDLMKGEEGANNTLTYFLAHKDKAARDASWGAFGKDPDWKTARKDSEKAGPILLKKGGVKSTLLTPTDYSPLK